MQQLAIVSAHGERAALHAIAPHPVADPPPSPKPPLLILHANGFGSALYAPMVAAGLADRFAVYALDAPGQAASPPRAAPGTPGALAAYPHLALAAVDWLVQRGRIRDRLYAFGHSGGGLAVVLAAVRRPGVFRAVYLFEPVLLPRAFLASTPDLVAGARRRRALFPSRAAAAASLAAKPPMARFDAAVLRAYVDTCLVPATDGAAAALAAADGAATLATTPVTLATTPADEAAVYSEAAELGAAAWRGVAQLQAVPTTIAGSGDGGPLAQVAPEAAAAAGARLDTFETLTHLGPFEEPAMVAARVVVAFEGAGRARL